MRRVYFWLGLSFSIVILDQVVKYVASTYLQIHQSLRVFSWFDLFLTYNPGAAFSFLADSSGWQRWFFIAVGFIATFYMTYLISINKEKKLFCLALSLIIGGAVGNLIDRIVFGAVVDFISLHVGEYYWPAFNLADSFICIGAFLILIEMFNTSERGDKSSFESS